MVYFPHLSASRPPSPESLDPTRKVCEPLDLGGFSNPPKLPCPLTRAYTPWKAPNWDVETGS